VKEVIVPIYPGLFSAWGMLASEQRRDFVRSRLSLVQQTQWSDVAAIFNALRDEAVAYFAADRDFSADKLAVTLSCDLRYLGQEHAVTVVVEPHGATIDSIIAEFHDAHEKTYTFRLNDTEIEFVTYRLKAEARLPRPEINALPSQDRSAELARRASRVVNFGEAGSHDAAVYDRALLPPGFIANGPAIVEEATSTTIVLPGQAVRVDAQGFLRIVELVDHSGSDAVA